MKSVLFALSFLALFIGHREGFAITDEQFGSIKRLGELNGIALHCKAMAETQKMKRALVLNLPKRRQLGELFDQETNNSFMKFIHDRATCPESGMLTHQVDEAIRNLENIFRKE